jgi:hypothetical protein
MIGYLLSREREKCTGITWENMGKQSGITPCPDKGFNLQSALNLR